MMGFLRTTSAADDTAADHSSQAVLAKIGDVLLAAANGDLEKRVLAIDPADPAAPVMHALNHFLDLTDAYVRETRACLQAAGEERFYRIFLQQGMRGSFGIGAGIINEAVRRMEQANHAKSQFLATMSHELRTPLNAIIGFAEMLVAQPDLDADKQREYAATIRQAGRHLLSLLNDILDLSRIEVGVVRLDAAPLVLAKTTHEGVEMLAGEARTHGIVIEVAVPESLVVMADERALRQILINLVGNAVKFTPAGGRVMISARPLEGEVEVTVADTGEGIAPEDIARVLEPFVQGEDAMNRRHGGAGLGLPLVKRLVELHGGRFRLESERGQGTRAIFTIPATSQTVETGESDESESGAAGSRHGL